jgi:hypothetical protein
MHCGRNGLGAEVRNAAPRQKLEEGGDRAELMRRVADGDAVSTTLVVDGVELGLLELALARDLAVMASDQARPSLARYSARCSVAIAAGGAGKPRAAAGASSRRAARPPRLP